MNTNLKNKNIMKKSLLTFILCTAAMGIGYAQFTDGTVLQPTSVTAKRFDESGQLIKVMNSTYTYGEDGKLIRYDLPDHVLWSTYSYNNNLLMTEYTRHYGGHPQYYETFEYTYENQRIKTKEHEWGQMNSPESWVYYYDEQGRLERMDYRDSYLEEYHMHYLYEYEDEGRTVIENYWTSWETQGMLLRKKTTSHYDEAFYLLDKVIENYSVEGELTQKTLTTYTYTPSGKEESEVTQTLIEGEWVNTEIIRYVYDANDRVMEWQVGEWSEDLGDWEITNKAVYELDEEALTYTISFYKKNGEEWTWDQYGLIYYIQPVFFEPYLKEAEHALRFYAYDDLFDSEHIGQFVFTLAEMNEPTYVGTEEKQELECGIYPNPGNGSIKVESPSEHAVVRFYDLQGKLMTARMFSFGTSINAESWPTGIYVWEIIHDNQKAASGKWVKK